MSQNIDSDTLYFARDRQQAIQEWGQNFNVIPSS
jgi:hypothetical protein